MEKDEVRASGSCVAQNPSSEIFTRAVLALLSKVTSLKGTSPAAELESRRASFLVSATSSACVPRSASASASPKPPRSTSPPSSSRTRWRANLSEPDARTTAAAAGKAWACMAGNLAQMGKRASWMDDMRRGVSTHLMPEELE